MAKKSVSGTSQDPTVRFTKLTLGDKVYSLAFDFNAIATAEASTGINLLQTLSLSGLNASQLRAVFFATLLKAHPETTLEEAGSLITHETLGSIANAVVQAWTGSMPDAKPEEEKDPNAATPGAPAE